MAAKVSTESKELLVKELINKANISINGKPGLEAENVPELRKYLRRLGINVIDRQGEQISVTKARKDEIITAITKEIAPTELIAEVFPEITSVEKEVLTEIKSELANDVSIQLATIAEKVYKIYVSKVSEIINAEGLINTKDSFLVLGYQLRDELDNYRTKEGKQLDAKTKLNYRGLVLTAIQEFINKESKPLVKEQLSKYFNNFRLSCFTAMEKTAKVKADEDTQSVAHRENNKIKLDISDLLNWAKDTLENINLKTRWQDVSIALALVTGRRQDEIHGEGNFELTSDEYKLSFSGQSKVKGESALYFEENPSYEIPTLIKAEIVYKAWQWLVQAGKTNKSNKFINDNFNNYLNQDVKILAEKHIKFYPFHEDTTFKPVFKSAKEKKVLVESEQWKADYVIFTYHKLREIYAIAAFNHFGVKAKSTSQKHYAALILGHDRSHKAGLGKSETATRYEADFELRTESLLYI